jgi:hypothetical protein
MTFSSKTRAFRIAACRELISLPPVERFLPSIYAYGIWLEAKSGSFHAVHFQHHVHDHFTHSSVCSKFVFFSGFHHLAPTYFHRPAVRQKFVMSDVLLAFFAVKTVATLIGSYSKPGILSHIATLARFSVLWLDE